LLNAEKNPHLKHIIRLRLARVLQGLNDHEGALKLLESVSQKESGEFEKLYEEEKGDSYLALKRTDDAKAAFQKAKQMGAQSPLLMMKLSNLGVTESDKP
jgi:predicted negative regulator of RcsB-dependent stress response